MVTNTSFVPLLVGVLVVVFASQADAQSAGRTATMQRCVIKAQARYPTSLIGGRGGRTATYRGCMLAAGYRP